MIQFRDPPLLLLLTLTLVLAPVRGAAAAASDWGRAEMVEARLVSAVEATGNAGTLPLALQVRLWPGWKTYWRSPGDAGLPPRIDWKGSDNLAGVDIGWPAPARFSVFGLETFGYEKELALPLAARLAAPGRPLALKAAVDLLVCHDICVPAHFDLALTLPAGPAVPGAEAELVAAAAARVPDDGRAAGLALTALRDASGADGPAVEIEATAREPFTAPDLFLEGEAGQAFRPPELSVDLGRRHLTARLALLPPPAGTPPVTSLAGQPLTVTLVDGERGLEARQPVAPAAADGPALATMLGFALLGGLILNLMPCVLPVLSLKLLAAIGHGGGETRRVRAGFLASAGGILACFLALAGVMIALKAAGAAAGWGIQFQQPVFLGVMAVVMAGFAANLCGLFEIPLPRAFAALAEGEGRLAGPFFTGVLAALLATPCSAPFLGTAVGFALARGAGEILAVFLALGFGLSLPYLLVAAWPRLATALPRPGRWMITLRRLLGLALAGTALWLGWLLALSLHAIPAGFSPQSETVRWRPFDPALVRTEVAAGHVVLVDVTADWCLTCLANQRLVLDRPEIAGRLNDSAGRVVALRADWTRPDEAISRYLAGFGRYGVPFNAVYGPGAPAGLPLPELLSREAVLDGLARAGGGP